MAVHYVGDGGPDGTALGRSATDKVSLYGATPVVQRASAVQATSNISLTTFMTINTNVAAFCLEVANTLIGIGMWKGAA
jgi:hypothetical protein